MDACPTVSVYVVYCFLCRK